MIDRDVLEKVQEYYDTYILDNDFCENRWCHMNGFLDACVCFGFMTPEESTEAYDCLRQGCLLTWG